MARAIANQSGNDRYGKLTGVRRNDDGTVNHIQYTKVKGRKSITSGVFAGKNQRYYYGVTPLPPKGKANPYKSRSKKMK